MTRARLAAVLLLACCSNAQPAGPACLGAPTAGSTSCQPFDALAVASDYSSSAVGGFDADAGVSMVSTADLGLDPALAVDRGRAFYVVRDQDTLFELDPRCGAPRARLAVHHANDTLPSNPQDVAVAPDGSLWVPWYNVPGLLVTDPCGLPRQVVDLSSYDSDGNPEASAVRIVDLPEGSKAFVALQVLDASTYASTRPSLMLRIDVASLEVEAEVQLAGRNPFSVFEQGSYLWLADPANFGAVDEPAAGVERFDTTTSTSTLLVSEHDLGGSAADVAVTDGCGAAIVADATPNINATSLVTFDPDTGALFASGAHPLLSTAGYFLQGMAWIGDKLLVGEGNPLQPHAAVVHVFDRDADAGGCALTEEPGALAVPLKPIALRPVP
jgi:hypothetical protein